MMDVTPLTPKGKQVIDGYGDGGFTVSDVRHEGALVILPDACEALAASTMDDIDEASFEVVVAYEKEVDILLLGTGNKQIFLTRALERYLKSKNIITEVMDTGAACRTYNVLLTEGRQVAAMLLPV